MRPLLAICAVLAFTSITFAAGRNPVARLLDTGAADTGAADTGTPADTATTDTGGDTGGSADGSDGSDGGSSGGGSGGGSNGGGSGGGGGTGNTIEADTGPLDPVVDDAGLKEWKGGGAEGCSSVPSSMAGLGLALVGLASVARRRRSA